MQIRFDLFGDMLNDHVAWFGNVFLSKDDDAWKWAGSTGTFGTPDEAYAQCKRIARREWASHLLEEPVAPY